MQRRSYVAEVLEELEDFLPGPSAPPAAAQLDEQLIEPAARSLDLGPEFYLGGPGVASVRACRFLEALIEYGGLIAPPGTSFYVRDEWDERDDAIGITLQQLDSRLRPVAVGQRTRLKEIVPRFTERFGLGPAVELARWAKKEANELRRCAQPVREISSAGAPAR